MRADLRWIAGFLEMLVDHIRDMLRLERLSLERF
jgi:hypothetical protein